MLDRATMDPRKLVYFATVVEHGSFNKAARYLSISQPALSTSMDRFEQMLGSKLLERSPTGIVPTPIGEALYAHARLIRDELDRAKQRLDAPASADAEVIAFGTLPSLATSIVPAAVCQWRRSHGSVRLRVVEKNQIELLLSLLRGELDFIVAQTELYDFLEGMRQRVLFRDRLHVLARPGHPALSLENPTWGQLASFPWVVQMMGRHRMLLEKVLAAETIALPSQLTESGSVDFIRALVAGTDSLAVLPAAAVSHDLQQGLLVSIGIEEPLLKRDIAVLFRDGITLSHDRRALLADIEAEGLARSQYPVDSDH